MGPQIMTVSGTYFDFIEPANSEFTIEDIAHALANICRFTGHVKKFYSVAQHSVYVSFLVPVEHALAGLLHDAAEAFLGDVSSPLKQLLPDYKAIEKRVEEEVLERVGLSLPLDPCIKQADLIMLATEKRDLMMPSTRHGWELLRGVTALPAPLEPWSPKKSEKEFLKRYYDLRQ